MKKKALSLRSLKVESFVTQGSISEKKDLKGGGSNSPTQCCWINKTVEECQPATACICSGSCGWGRTI